MRYTDPSGHFFETFWDAANVAMGAGSLVENVRGGNWRAAALDAGGLVLDVAATAIPVIPGGAATAIRMGRAANRLTDAVGVANKVDDVVDAAKFAENVDDVGDLGKQLDNFEPCPWNSFTPETYVWTVNGLEPISTVDVDELVYAYNEGTGTTGLYTVTATISHLDAEVWTLVINGEKVHTTYNHPFYVDGRWVDASDLRVGDDVRRADGSTGEVQRIEIAQRPQVMYNLSVAEAHAFFVGQQQWLVHNCTEVAVSKSKYPESAKHIEDVQAAGHPTKLTIDRSGAAQNRKASLAGTKRQSGLDRDEYPPAMFQEGGKGASVRPIRPSDNRGAGSCMGQQCRKLPDGTQVEIVVVP